MTLADFEPWTDEAERAVREIARREARAAGMVMRTVLHLGGKAEGMLGRLPAPARRTLEDVTLKALEHAHDAAARFADVSRAPRLGAWSNRAAVTATGAAGGFAGLPGLVVEVPATVTIMFGAIQRVAAGHGFDPRDPATRLEAVRVFGSGGPRAADDGVDTSFVTSRVAINGPLVHAMLRSVAPRFAAVLGQKLAAHAVPVLGAVAGAGVNWVFLSYYEEMAQVRFGLARLASEHGAERVQAAFAAASREVRGR